VLEYAALTDGYDQAPDASVLAYMHESEKAEVRQASVALGRMMELASGFSHQDAGARVQQMVELSRLEGEALRTLGSPPKEPLQNVIVEDSYGTRMSVAASLNLSTHIREMERCLSERICMSSEYIRLRNAFVDRFGEGGVCIDISSFLSDTTDHVIEIFGMANRAEGMDAVRAEPGSRLGVTAHIQISAPDAQGAQGGSSSEPLVVVNRVYEGIGWLSARFACGHLPENAMVRRRLEEWIQHVYSPREPVDFLINADCNDLQAHPRLTKRTFAWPGEPLRLPAGEVVDAAQLVIRHDPLTGLLDLFDQDRRPIALVYLGSVLPTFAWGVPYVVWVLSHPFKIRRPAMSPSLEASAEDVIRQPRLTQGNVVLRRATWWIRSSYLKEHWFSKGGLSQLMGVARHAEKWQIPHTFFSQRMLLPPKSAVVPASVLDSSPKPIWVDRRSPFSLCLMEQMTAQSEWLVVTEALPNPEESVVRLAGQRHVSEIQIEMLIRAA
jgi:hypothetical protein